MSPTAALLFYNRAAVESNRGSGQARTACAVKGAHEQKVSGNYIPVAPTIKFKPT
jgi:hypothetical protein